MKIVWDRKKIILAVVLFLSIITVFFVEWSFDKETLSRGLSLTDKGITSFRKGLDVSGGTRLTYKISYDKYESAYAENNQSAELNAVKNTVENIILKNIDNRISKL